MRPENRLNDLEPKRWIRFQKSWFVHNPPARSEDLLLHPAKFPETMVQEFIEFFTKRGQVVLDPMVGTGSTLVACYRAGRRGIGIELNPRYAQVARQRIGALAIPMPFEPDGLDPAPEQVVLTGDARKLDEMGLPQIDYCITSPPYWDMLKRKGFETQRRRKDLNLDVSYSDSPQDLGNITEYERFLEELVGIYRKVQAILKPGAYLTVIVKNVKKGGKMYPLAWELGKRLGDFYVLMDEKIWCQDNQALAPYGMFYSWVSNTHHHYCLNFQKER
ncbi:MAG: site-specific DNA-methyltransferase [Chloroflexi bacterium]|nr:site-specific DNA-methyltransferase [Chloroflexota bacterium]